MILDLDRYRRVIKPLVKLHIQRNSEVDKGKELTTIAQSTECHILAVAYFMEELFGKTEELTAKIESLQKFYHHVEVINKE